MNMMQAGWLTDLTNWLRELVVAVFGALVQFFKDMIVLFFEATLNLAEKAINALSVIVPDGLANFSICGTLAQGGPTVLWAMNTFHIPEGMALVTGAFVFRLLRKALTLFQW